MKTEKSYFCNCLYFSAGSLARNLTRLAEDAFAKTGLSPSHAFSLLAILKQPGISPSQVAKELHMTPSTITRFLDKLEQKGFINRELEGKSYSLFGTDKGLSRQSELEAAWQQLLKNYNDLLGADLAATLASQIYDASVKLQ